MTWVTDSLAGVNYLVLCSTCLLTLRCLLCADIASSFKYLLSFFLSFFRSFVQCTDPIKLLIDTVSTLNEAF